MGGLVYLFRSGDVERIDPASVQRDVSYQSQAGRRLKGTPKRTELSLGEVCTRLAITPQALGSLVKKRYLIAAASSHVAGNRRFFDPEHVNAYAARFKENPLLIELDDAATSVGCTRQAFLRKYVLTGLVTLADDGASRQYIDRDQLATASGPDIDWLPLSRAAEELGVSTARLKNLRTTGRIETRIRTVLGRSVHYFPLQNCRRAIDL